jgi:predicted nucleic acid-binding protein
MAIFVVDASAALGWCFEDEANAWTDGLLERLRQGDRIVVPAHWPTETLNGLLVASRRKRIKADQPALFWDELARLALETEPALTASQAKTVLTLGEKHGLTAYDSVLGACGSPPIAPWNSGRGPTQSCPGRGRRPALGPRRRPARPAR